MQTTQSYQTIQCGPLLIKVRDEVGDSYDDAINKGMRDLAKADTKFEIESALRRIYFGEVYTAQDELHDLRDITEFANEALQAVQMNGSHGRHPLIAENQINLERRIKTYKRNFHPTPMQQIFEGNIVEGLRHLYHDFFTGRYAFERKFA